MADDTQFLLDFPPAAKPENTDLSQVSRFAAKQFRGIRALLAGGLRWENLRAAKLTGTSPGVAGTQFVLTHSLNKLPELFLWNLDQAGSVYADATDRAAWTATTIALKCSVANAAYTMLVL